MPRKDKVIHISNLPSTFRGNVTRNGRFIQNGIPPLGGAYDKVAKSTGLIRLGNEFLYNGINNLVSKDNREKLMNNTAGRLINYVKDFNKESFPSDDELGPTFPFNIIQTPRSNGKKLPQKQYAVGGKIPNVVAGGIAQEAEQRKQLQAGQQQLNITSDKMTNPMTMYQRSSFINKYKCGGRRKAWIGAAIGAAGSLIGGMFGSKGQQPIQVKQADQASYSAPKTGLERPEWITNGTVQQPVMPQSVYRDRLNVYRCGGHKR